MGEPALRTAELILTRRDRVLLEIANVFAELPDKENLKRLLLPISYSLEAAYRMCGLLAQVYPEQAGEVAQVVRGEGATAGRGDEDKGSGSVGRGILGRIWDRFGWRSPRD